MSSHRDATSALSALRRWELNATAIRALAVVAVLVAVGAGVVAWRARPAVEPVAPAPSSSASAQPDTIVVAVGGLVMRPGLVRLPAGARVADALDAAGGVVPGTDLVNLNLARKVADGELITVGAPAPGGSDSGGLVNLNTATPEQLQTLPGIGPVLSARIIEYREDHGGFATVTELGQVSGIGEARYSELKSLVTV